jgi:hypothetical protein
MASKSQSAESNAFNEISKNLIYLEKNDTGTIKFFDN